MASAILASRNGNAPRSTDFISSFTNNSNRNFTRLNNSPNANPNSSHFISRNVVWKHPPPRPTEAGSSINYVPANSNGYRYITFRLSSYTKRELNELRKRLISDLERVRVLRQCICSTTVPKHRYHPPVKEVAVGQKRTKPFPSPVVRDKKKHCCRVKNNKAHKSKFEMRKCGQILGKLMQHKHGWVFNSPVDVESLNLYNYHKIITSPMDLGTIKLKLMKNEYESPLSFASDVRLTFENAMLYNGKGSDVFAMAERLLFLFEDLFNSIQQKIVGNQVKKQKNDAVIVKKPLMTADEKTEMASRFLNSKLSPEGMDQIMAVLKKSVGGLQYQGVDEIELDFEVLDNDTLWDLHTFIDNRTRLLNDSSQHDGSVSEAVVDEACRITDGVEGEEDIDIGEEMQMQSTNFPSIGIEKDAVNVSSTSRGSSSSESDSSSSDTTSGGGSSGNSYNQEHEAN